MEEFRELPRVTSDCKVWPSGGQLAVCLKCGTMQKLLSRTWLSEIKTIYDQYELYYQSGGAEQPVFKGQSLSPRSAQILKFIDTTLRLPEDANVLDFGCGTGTALETFSRGHAGWTLFGSEQADKNVFRLQSLQRIPGFKKLFTCNPEEIDGQFNLITAIHSIEHVLDPTATLESLARKLTSNGAILVQVPDCGLSPYDLVIADHLTHFQMQTLQGCAERSSIGIDLISSDVVPKELTLVGRHKPSVRAERELNVQKNMIACRKGVSWLKHQLDDAREISESSRSFGVFGTSISATWMYGAIAERIQFFVDEDPGRIGRTHCERPILSPQEVDSGSDVYMPLIGSVSSSIVDRLRGCPMRIHTPPGDDMELLN